ncbi:PIN domain-containing protein [Jiella sp. M17.18]|uniref:PIN domain-containing protein n=1 Tax=Jiella sp. M17.18 TaxID=3234247 RepID=UPI0034DF0783
MIGVDTNVLLRFILADDPAQHDRAAEFFTARTRAEPAFVSIVVLIEAVWYLRQVAKVRSEAVATAFLNLLSLEEIRFEDRDYLQDLFADREKVKAGISDYLIARASRRAGCMHTVTFDQKAARDISGMELLA